MRLFSVAAVLVLFGAGVAVAQVSGSSPSCGSISGKTTADLQNVRTFCQRGIPEGVSVGAYAMETLLVVKVTRSMADGIRADRISGEQLVRTWMRGWKQITESTAVTVYVKWQDVEIAEGQTTLFGGDEVTIR